MPVRSFEFDLVPKYFLSIEILMHKITKHNLNFVTHTKSNTSLFQHIMLSQLMLHRLFQSTCTNTNFLVINNANKAVLS